MLVSNFSGSSSSRCLCDFSLYPQSYIKYIYVFVDGAPGGFCDNTIQCKDTNSACTDNVCRCFIRYTDSGGVCIEGNLQMLSAYSPTNFNAFIHL